MTITFITTNGEQTFPPDSAGGPTVPDPTGAPDGQVVTTLGGAYVLAVPARGADTSLQDAPDTGWTATGNVEISGGVVTLTLGPSNTLVRLRRPIPTSPLAPMLELTARVRRTGAATGTDHGVGIGFINDAWNAGVFMDARTSNSGEARCFYADGGGWQFINSMNFIPPGSLDAAPGNESVWLRMVITPSYTAFYTDTGATRPTDWGRLGRRILRIDNVSNQSLGVMTGLEILALRGAGTGTAVFEVTDIQWRSLLGAPT